MDVVHLLNLAQQHHQAGHLAEAESLYRTVLQQQPAQVGALYGLGVLAHQAGKVSEAIARYHAVLAVQPNHAAAHSNLGVALQQQGNRAAAIERFRKAVRLQPQFADAHRNLAQALKLNGELDAAIAHFETVLHLQPDSADAYRDLSDALQEADRLDAAIALCERVCDRYPDHVTLHGSRIRALLISGRLREGFAAYDTWRLRRFSPRSFVQPVWDGSPLQGQSILLYAEAGAGYGDTLQFVRYAPLVAEHGGQVIVECQPPLVRLLQSIAGLAAVIPAGAPLPAFSMQAALMSLPRIFGTTLATIPAQPYLPAPSLPAIASPTRTRQIGLVWGGNPDHLHDRERSCPLSEMQRFLASPHTQFYSLQVGPHRAELASLPAGLVHDWGDRLHDFAATAAAIAPLDLVISVDTAVAHLAGAMGKPVWLLLAFAPDWRWLMHRDDSPWYPTMRLFRQPRREDWATVCDRVATALSE